MKRALKITGFFVGLLLSSIILLALMIDANMFKPRIVAMAKDRGVALEMRGDLHWAFWPSLGIAVNDVRVASEEKPKDAIVHIQKASFLMAVIPLLQGNFLVKHILIDGADINFVVDDQGNGNWKSIIAAQKTPAVQASNNNKQPQEKIDASVTSDDLRVTIEKINVRNSSLIYIDHSKNRRIDLKNISLAIDDVNANEKPFPVNFSWLAQMSDSNNIKPPVIINGTLKNLVALSKDFQSIDLTEGELTLDFGAPAAAAVAMTYAFNIDKKDDDFQYRGRVAAPNFNARELINTFSSPLKTANKKALTNVSFSAEMNGDKKHFAAREINLHVDKTRMNGDVVLADFTSQAIKLDVQGDDINVDDYLAPKVVDATASQKAASGDEPLLSLAVLRALNIELKATLNNVVFSGWSSENIQIDVTAKNGIIQQQLNAAAYGGSFHEEAYLDARGDTAHMKFEGVAHSIELAKLLDNKKLGANLALTGSIQANADGEASGVTLNQIMNSLIGSATFSGAKVRLSPLNIEQQFCSLINLVNKTETAQQDWAEYSDIRELSGKVTIAKKIIVLSGVNAEVEKLMLGVNGSINLNKGTYDFTLPLKLNRDSNDTPNSITTSAHGCMLSSNYWAERGMSLLRCQGAYATMAPTQDCRPDKAALAALTKDYAVYKLREKHGKKIDEKKSQLIKKLDDKLGGEGGTEQARSLLKNLFKKKND